jgi:N-methylhydantoinase B
LANLKELCLEPWEKERFMTSDPFFLEKQRLALKGILNKLLGSLGGEIHAALLDSRGDLLDAGGPNPVHFPAIEATVKATRKYLVPKVGETLITNDPYSGNPRLCDLLLVQGAYGRQQAGELRYYVAIQITVPQLLGRLSKWPTSIEDEGLRIPPTPLEQGTVINDQIVQYLAQSGQDQTSLKNLLEQARAALKKATADIIALENRLGRENFTKGLDDLNKYSEKMMRSALREIPDGEYSSFEVMESDGSRNKNLKIQCRLSVQGENILVSFLGTAKQTTGPINCTYALTLGACFWVLRGFVKRDIPTNAGAFKAFSIEAPEGTLVNAAYPAPLLGGYFETSKRIVEVLFVILNKALPTEIPAHNGATSSLCVFNFSPKILVDVAGCGGGATKTSNGAPVCQTDLQNSPALSIEELEENYPIQITHSGPRLGSGGEGKKMGGDGLTRGYKMLSDASVICFGDRRQLKPKGLFGGGSALASEYTVVKGQERSILHEKGLFQLSKDSVFILNSAGGGAWGKKEKEEAPET